MFIDTGKIIAVKVDVKRYIEYGRQYTTYFKTSSNIQAHVYKEITFAMSSQVQNRGGRMIKQKRRSTSGKKT